MVHDDVADSDSGGIDRRRLLEALGAGSVVAIAGCTGGGSGGGSANGSSGGSGDGSEIQFLTMGVGDNIEGFFNENNTAFEEEYDANLQFTSVTWDSAQSTLNTRVDGNRAPDVSRLPARWVPQFVGNDALQPLDEMINGEFGDKFYEGMRDANIYQGTYWGVPWASSNKCLYYNKNVFEKAGLDPENPQLNTWDEMLAAAKQIKGAGNVSTPAYGLPAADAIETGSQYYHYHWSFGADLVEQGIGDSGTANPVVNSEAAANALSFYSSLVNEHNVTQSSPLSATRQDVRRLFENGDLGMVIAHVYAGLNIRDSDANFDFGIVQVPEGPEGRFSLNTIDSLTIYSQSENKELARNLLEFYYDEERRFQYSKQKGFLPVMKSVGDRDFFTEDRVWSPFVEAAEYARARPKIRNFNEFNNRMVTAIQETVGGQKSAQKALDDAQSDLEELMS
jgi:ABC-type glycerol-3-phosphate transport system substrate-binding protein